MATVTMATIRSLTRSQTSSLGQAEGRNDHLQNMSEELDRGIELTARDSISRISGQVSTSPSEHHSVSEQSGNLSQNGEREQPGLPAADGGLQAWLVLAASSLIQVPVWGKLS
jgi:hypothetical protein